ncbi:MULTISPECIES: FimV/HubP family polar landmark protein [unclassified Caballeronia]|uniref:FimV/HubP family polar landmark protein n=1 Tax=unclassified Caballeronia TaxID=2646786 RepID=UPI002860979E|nr:MULTISPECIES: FimV/HubP family polar landmark protein [unclassified Caballeronia]MDR5739104.1 FimV/HubP family polar landmark protein [Caballeronia sp. LZ016]MDR5807592.1 FimV/HubP family polar landmark protein [Caballeronia sp. LZ019]
MIRRPRRSFIPSSRAALAAASVAICTLLWTNPGAALAQASGAAADNASVAVAPGQRYTVKPGQSLSDVAGELTGSKERAVREKMARALFDANPNAFAGHDINRLKLGAVLNVPASDTGGASAPQGPVGTDQSSAPVAAPTAPATSAPEVTAEAASDVAPAAAGVEPASAVEPASEPQTAPAVEPAASAAIAETTPARRVGLDPMLLGLAIAVLVLLFLLMMWRSARRRRANAQAEADAKRRQRPTVTPAFPARLADTGAADLEGKAVQRDESELNAVAASIESYEAAQSFAAPSDDNAAPSVETGTQPAAPSAPFVPSPPAALHAGFVPPPHAASEDEQEREAHDREIAAREAAAREAEKWEAEERQAAALQAATQEAEEREIRAREAAARDALAAEIARREGDAREAAEQEAQAQQAREAAAREIIAREAELRDAQAQAEHAAHRDAHQEEPAEDGEPAPGDRFPMPKFPTEAVEALDSLDLGLPPRMELTLATPAVADAEPALQDRQTPIEPVPFVPQPVAETDIAHPPKAEPLSAAAQIEAGTAGPASVAGLGATQFGPLSLDFNLDLPSSHSEPLPSLTPAQLATIARNKLELAVEYIELGDLGGARTLLQEVIASNDTATRQQAAALLSTLAPHS